MNFDLSEEQQLLCATVRAFVDKEVAPQAAAADAGGGFRPELLAHAAELGLMGLTVPEAYGGAGLDAVAYALAIEELARGSAALAVIVAVNSLVCDGLIRFGSEAQKQRYLPELARGTRLGCYALTEPQAGSDAAAIRTRAAHTESGYVLDGTKLFITNGAGAGLALVYAVTDPAAGHGGISAFLVERGAPGFSVSRSEDKMGLRAADTSELVFDGCRISEDQRLGREGEGFAIAMTLLDGGRIGIAAQALGIAQAALDAAADYARQRQQFGRTIGEFQPIQWLLADSATELAAARVLTRRAAWLRATGQAPTRAAAQAKLLASEAANRIAYRALQVFGGYGYVKPFEVERLYRDARITTLYEGTSEIQRLVIARAELGDA